jgi:hypothetical protein
MSFLSSMLAFCAASKESIWDLKHSSYSLRLLATAADSPTASACASSASFASCGADRAAAACGTLKLNTPNLAVASIPTVTMIALQVARCFELFQRWRQRSRDPTLANREFKVEHPYLISSLGEEWTVTTSNTCSRSFGVMASFSLPSKD